MSRIDREQFSKMMMSAEMPLLPDSVDSVELAAGYFARFMQVLGFDPYGDDHHLRDTPVRVAEMYAELLRGPDDIPNTSFDEDMVRSSQMVLVRGIPFTSFCAHHWLPFRGHAHVAYIPSGQLIGLSKIARIVVNRARSPQVQERLTDQITTDMIEATSSVNVAVVLQAEHTCMTIRGVRAHGAETITSSLSGAFLNNDSTRAEFYAMAGVNQR